jgi:hypothetical protein
MTNKFEFYSDPATSLEEWAVLEKGRSAGFVAGRKEERERMMKFTDWYAGYIWPYAEDRACPDKTLDEAFKYWQENVEGK